MPDYNFRWSFLGGLCHILAESRPQELRTVCEWGAGYSTFLFNAVAQGGGIELLLSLDHYAPYMEEVTKLLPQGANYRPVVAELFDSDRVGAEPATLFYTTAPLALGCPLDLSLVDGRARTECLLVAALASAPGATVVLDDSARIRYTPGLLLFDEIGAHLRFKALRLKPALAPYFHSFQEEMRGLAGLAVAAPADGRKGGMGHVPALLPLTEAEAGALTVLLGRTAPKAARVLCWGAEDLVRAAADALGPSGARIVHIGDKGTGALELAGVSSRVLSLTGGLDDKSQDPNLHYASAPAHWRDMFDIIVVGGQRRNECLLTAAYLLAPGGHVLVRDGTHPHHAPGRFLFEPVETAGTFLLARRKAGLGEVFDGLREELFACTTAAGLRDA